jgi:translation initiation factor IF-2
MQQRRVRLGDVLDDYCPRERRITNHAVVAMIEDDVKQTRCTTCDAEHEYKHAKIPPPRRKKPAASVPPSVEAPESPVVITAEETVVEMIEDPPVVPEPTIEAAKEPAAADVDEPVPAGTEDEWPVHRPLIRATLPRPEGQAPERKPTDFTIRQSGGRFDSQRNGNKSRGNRHAKQAQGHSSGQSRFGNPRQGHGSRHGGGQHTGNQQQRQGNRPGHSGQRGGRPGQGGGQGRPGQGRGPKRGR